MYPQPIVALALTTVITIAILGYTIYRARRERHARKIRSRFVGKPMP